MNVILKVILCIITTILVCVFSAISYYFYDQAQLVVKYIEEINNAVYLEKPEVRPENDNKYVIFSGVPTLAEPAETIEGMPEGAVWYKKTKEVRACHEIRRLNTSKSVHHNSKYETVNECDWYSDGTIENNGKINIGAFENIDFAHFSTLIDFSWLGKFVNYCKRDGEIVLCQDEWSGDLTKNKRFKLYKFDLDTAHPITVFAKQKGNSITNPGFQGRAFWVLAVEGEKSKAEMIEHVSKKVSNHCLWELFYVFMGLASLMLIITICLILRRNKNA